MHITPILYIDPVLNLQLYLLEIILSICGKLDTTVMNIFGKVKISLIKNFLGLIYLYFYVIFNIV